MTDCSINIQVLATELQSNTKGSNFFVEVECSIHMKLSSYLGKISLLSMSLALFISKASIL